MVEDERERDRSVTTYLHVTQPVLTCIPPALAAPGAREPVLGAIAQQREGCSLIGLLVSGRISRWSRLKRQFIGNYRNLP